MSGSQPVKQQHYVPQFHLRQWSNGREPHHIGVYDKTRDNIFVTGTRNVGGENWFFHARGEPQPIEELLSKLEGMAARVYRKIIEAEDAAALNEVDRVALRMHVMALSVRTAEHRAGTRQLYQDLADRIVEALGVTDWKLVFSDDVHRVAQLQSVLEAVQNHDLLASHQISVFVNKTGTDLLTSDHPLTRHNDLPPTPGEGGRLGLVSPHVQLHLPISPAHSVLLFNVPEAVRPFPTKQVLTDPEHALFFRSLQLTQSHSQVFGTEGEDFQSERDAVGANPEVGNPLRPRFTSG